MDIKKVMKKSLSMILSTTIAFSAFTSVSFGATANDFTDLKNLESSIKTKYDYLINKEIFEGVEKDRFGINEEMNRAQFAKVAALLFEFTVNKNLSVSSFTDVKSTDKANGYAVGYIEAIKNAGITKGVSIKEFLPDGKVTREQLATLLVRGLGKESELNSVSPVNDVTVSDWAKKYVALALKYELMTTNANNTFGGTTNATRDTLAISAYNTKILFDKNRSGNTTITELKATGVKKLTVKFNQAVDPTKVKLEVKSLNNIVNIDKTEYASDKTSVEILFTNALLEAEYTVYVNGLTSTPLTQSVKVSSEKVTNITINDKSLIQRGTNDAKISINYNIFNQYNEDITDIAGDVYITSSTGSEDKTTSKPGSAVYQVISGKFNIGDTVSVSILHRSTGSYKSLNTKVSQAATVDTIEISKLYHSDTTKTLTANSSASGYKLLIKAKDQYGNAVDDKVFSADTLLSLSDNGIFDVVRDSSTSDPVYSTTTVDGVKYISLQLKKSTAPSVSNDFIAGKSRVRIQSKSTGKYADLDIIVKDVQKVDKLVFTSPLLAIAGENINVPFAATDNSGLAITDEAILNSTVTLRTSNKATAKFTQDSDKKTTLIVTPDPSILTAHTLTIYATTNSGSYSTSINVGKKAEPTKISGLSADEQGNDFYGAILLKDTQMLKSSRIVVHDQYGRKITPTWGNSEETYQIKIDSSDMNTISINELILNDTKTDVTFDAKAKGSSDITFKLQTGKGKDISNSQYTANIKVVDKADIKQNYEIADISKLYQKQTAYNTTKDTVSNSSAYDRPVVVKGKVDGKYVFIPKTNYTISSDLLNVTSLNANAVKAELIKDGIDKKASVTVIVTTDTSPISLSKVVTYSNAIPAVKSYELIDQATFATDKVVKKESDLVVSVNATAITTQALINELASAIVKTTDIYDVELKTAEFNTPVIVTNISNQRTVTTIAAGDTFYVTCVSSDSKTSIIFKVIAK